MSPIEPVNLPAEPLAGDRKVSVVFSDNARANLHLRSITMAEVKQALLKGSVASVDDRTGHFVYKLDDALGGIRVVAEKHGDKILVLTAIRPQEFLEHA